MKEIVGRIRDLCKKKNTSITKIEEKLGYANGTIGKWAKAKRKPPLEKVIAIASELDTTAEYILNGEQIKKPDVQTDAGLTEQQRIAIDKIKSMSPDELAKKMTALNAVLDM